MMPLSLSNRPLQNKQQEVHDYLEERVMPLLAPLQLQLLKQRPQDLSAFCLHYLRNRKSQELDSSSLREIDSDQIPQQQFRAIVRLKLKNKRRGSRQGIIGDRPKQGFLNAGYQYLSSPGKQWPQQITISLIIHLRKCVFFEHLHTSQLLQLITRMRAIEFKANEVLIREGESGNQLFIVDSGILKCQKSGSEQILKIYGKGEIFGQLALLYNHSRASTVTAIQPGTLFALPRPEFAAILHTGMMTKLRECEELIDKVDIFDSLNIYERSKLYESMQLKLVGPQKYIIKEGETGNSFYIVADGQLVAYKLQNQEHKLVYTYQRGDYFGEIALLRNLPRQASVKTVSDVRLYFINSECFARVLGPLEIILKRNQERYAKLANELEGTD